MYEYIPTYLGNQDGRSGEKENIIVGCAAARFKDRARTQLDARIELAKAQGGYKHIQNE